MTSGPMIPETVSTVVVARHAEAWKNLGDEPPDAHARDSLTPRGRRQARDLVRAVGSRPLDVVLASPAVRTVQTAEHLATDRRVPVVVTPLLGPLDDGEATWDERKATWARGEDSRPAGGETLGAGIDRALEAIRIHGRACTAIVSHEDITAGLIGELLGTPLVDRVARHELETGTAYELVRTADGAWTGTLIQPRDGRP